MKITALLLSILCLAPAVALAQQGPPPPGGGQMHQPSAAMRANRQQMMQQRQAFRKQVLGSLSAAHRQLLADVVGQLAVADKPDYKGAVAKLDAALSPNEKQAILSANSQMMAQMKAQHQKMMQQWKDANPNASPGPMQAHRGNHGKMTPDAGRILLMAAGGRGVGMMGGGWRHPHQP